MKNDKVFLATTANEDFWDISYPIVFLGEWCKRYSRKKFCENIVSETLPSYFEEKNSHEIYLYLNTLFERLLFVLHKQMNQIHGTNFSIRYWRIILGPWLCYYVHAMYDRYKNLEHFIRIYPDFTSICLDKECFITPKDTMHFVCHVTNDDYNLQIYSSILFWLGYKLPTKRLAIAIPNVKMYFTDESQWPKKILKYIYNLVCRMFQNKHQVLVFNAYFSRLSLFKLILKTKGFVWPCAYDYQDLPDFPINHRARKSLGSFDFGNNEFEKMLISFIPSDMPQSMIEGFSFLGMKIKNVFISKPNIIMSAVSWWFDNAFQRWAAESAEKGAMLLGMQHGGNYGIAKNSLLEYHELGILDRFYSWGWEYCDAHAKVIPMPGTKLIEAKNKSSKRGNGVLYATGLFPRYLIQFPLSTDYCQNYILNQFSFISHLSESITGQLRMRPHREDYGWDVRDRMRERFPQIKIESWNISFSDSLNNCSVCVSDYPLYSTTFIESLRSNRPTIIFYSSDFTANTVRDEAMDFFNQLKSNSIIFDDPIMAARHLNSVYGSIESWWNEPKRQEAVRNFLYRFGRTSPTWLQDWSEEISNVVKITNIRTIVDRKR